MEGSNIFGLLLMIVSGLIFTFWTINAFVQPYTTPSIPMIDLITINREIIEVGPIVLLGVAVLFVSVFMIHGQNKINQQKKSK